MNRDVCDIERSVIGGILIDNAQIRRVSLSPDEFGSNIHRAIFAAALALDARGEPIDPCTVRAELKRTNALNGESTQVQDVLADAMVGVPKSANTPYWAEEIRRIALRRQQKEGALFVVQAIDEGESDARISAHIESLAESSSRLDQQTGLCATGAELAKAEIVLQKPLIDGLIDEGNRGIVFGDAQAGKSLWALALLAHLAGGFKFGESWNVQQPQKVVMLFFEDRLTPGGGWPPRILWRYQSILAGLRANYGDTTEAEANLLIWCGTDQHEALNFARSHGSRLTAIDSFLNVTTAEDEFRREGIQRDFDRIHSALNNEAFLVLDHTRKGPGDKPDGDSDSLFGSVRKKGVCDVVIKLVAEEAPNGDQGVVVKRVKGRDGLDLPAGGRFLGWSGMPAGQRIPLDEVVELHLRHEQDRAGGQLLGERSVEQKEERWSKLENSLRAAGGSRPLAECAELAGVKDRTVRRWANNRASPFFFNANKEIEVRYE